MRQRTRFMMLAGMALGVAVAVRPAHAAPPAPAPTDVKTGELDLTFTQRSPLSARKEIARRLSLKEAELGEDYDLSSRPFKAYVPPNYDPAVPHGVFVYLGYKDSVSVATLWEPALDKAHLIFITPVCHHGEHYPDQVPLWQVMGLALDAVDNLKRLYNIDARRLYLMSFSEGSMRMSLGAVDVFSGVIVDEDLEWCQRMVLPDRRAYPPSFPQPPAALFQLARQRGIVMASEDFNDANQPPQLIVLTMKRNGFLNVLAQPTSSDDVHYPNLKPEWLEGKVLPFLDKAALNGPAPRLAAAPPAQAAPGAPPAAATTAPAGNPEADHLLRVAKLYIQNGQPALARPKLEAILRSYPKDPAAKTAKELLASLPASPDAK